MKVQTCTQSGHKHTGHGETQTTHRHAKTTNTDHGETKTTDMHIVRPQTHSQATDIHSQTMERHHTQARTQSDHRHTQMCAQSGHIDEHTHRPQADKGTHTDHRHAQSQATHTQTDNTHLHSQATDIQTRCRYRYVHTVRQLGQARQRPQRCTWSGHKQTHRCIEPAKRDGHIHIQQIQHAHSQTITQRSITSDPRHRFEKLDPRHTQSQKRHTRRITIGQTTHVHSQTTSI